MPRYRAANPWRCTIADSPLTLSRAQVLAYRRQVGGLDRRLPPGKRSLRTAGWAGFQDSMPRAALLSIHARIEQTPPSVLDDPSLVQVWGPRFSVYVVPARDLAVFTVGRTPDRPSALQRAEDVAASLRDVVGDREMDMGEAAHAIGIDSNRLRYATTTGTVVIRWDGARSPTVRTVPRPGVSPSEARRELARRFLHVFGPATSASFAGWAGIRTHAASVTFDELRRSLTPVATPIGDGWILSEDEARFRAESHPAAPVRLLPSGDSFYLLWGDDRTLLVPDAGRRSRLWTSRVWPGALLLDGEIAGTWRRSRHEVTIEPWRRLKRAERDLVAAEAETLPLPGLTKPITVSWAE